MNEQTQQLSQAIVCGLETLSDPEIRIPARDAEALANFKGILRAIISGELVLATPDRVLPEGVKTPEEVNKDS